MGHAWLLSTLCPIPSCGVFTLPSTEGWPLVDPSVDEGCPGLCSSAHSDAENQKSCWALYFKLMPDPSAGKICSPIPIVSDLMS